MVRIERFVEAMQKIAPLELAADFDNPGLLIDSDTGDINKVLVALDCTDDVVREAIEGGFDMVLTHHPLIFSPFKKITKATREMTAAYELIRHGIALYSAHTNLDIADGGVNDVLSGIYGLKNVVKLEPENYGRVGELETPMSLVDFAILTDKLLATRSKCTIANGAVDPHNIIVRRVGVLGGSGGDDIELMKQYGVDVFVTGEIKHNRAIDAQHIGLNVVVAGHYETEKPVLNSLINSLQKYDFDVQYKLSSCERSCLLTI